MHPINPAPGALRLGCGAVVSGRIVLRFFPVNKTAPCPRCRGSSGRVHSKYWRRAADLPVSGNRVEVIIHARRFFCDGEGCDRTIFCERFPGVLGQYARFTDRARAALLELAHASSAKQAARVVRLLGFVVSGASLITFQRRERFTYEAPRAIGVDEFAWRRGFRYGTLIVDLERRRPVDLLPADSADEFSHWLSRHPPVGVIARDRDEVFAHAARKTAPDALQVADRFHLTKNVLDTFRDCALSRKWKSADEQPVIDLSTPPPPAGGPEPEPTPRRRLKWEQVQALAQEGNTIRRIARALGMHRRTVRKYMSSQAPPIYRLSAPKPSMLDRHMEYLRARWDEGVRNSARLYKEICERGYQGSFSLLRRMVGTWRGARPQRRPMTPRPPIRLAIRWRRSLTEEETAELDRFLEANPELADAYRLKESFREAMARRDASYLDTWLVSAAGSAVRGFHKLARGMRHDYAAVSAAFATPWSNGQSEGQINRVKLKKRVGFGRANPDLLRVRVLHRTPSAA